MNIRDELIQVGAYIESKNGVEFSVRIDKIEGSRVTVKWTNDWQDDCYQTIDKSIVRVDNDGCLSVPNWTIRK